MSNSVKENVITLFASLLFAILVIASIRIDLNNQEIINNGKKIKVYLPQSELERCKTSKKGSNRHLTVIYINKSVKMLINKYECQSLNALNTFAKYSGGEYCIHTSFNVSRPILILKFCGVVFLFIFSGITLRKLVRSNARHHKS